MHKSSRKINLEMFLKSKWSLQECYSDRFRVSLAHHQPTNFIYCGKPFVLTEKWRGPLSPTVAHNEWNPRPATAGACGPSHPWQDEGCEKAHYCSLGLGQWVSKRGWEKAHSLPSSLLLLYFTDYFVLSRYLSNKLFHTDHLLHEK